MRICVVGAGAIGGVIAAGLAAADAEVSVLARGATLRAIRADCAWSPVPARWSPS
jgi:2-dehydropantoate 2-reductase